MTTYRVTSDTLHETVEAANANEAARKALELNDSRPGPTTLAFGFECQEKGKEAVYKLTEKVLRDCGRLIEKEKCQ